MEFLFKSSVIITFFYVFYQIFLKKETFFNTIRAFFILGILTSIMLPNIYIPIHIEQIIPQNITPKIEFIQKTNITENIPVLQQEIQQVFNRFSLLKSMYLIGLAFVLLKISIELFSLTQIIKKGRKIKLNHIIYVEIDKDISPFSVFNYIVYNPNIFSKSELQKIKTHEKVHVNQKHTYDLILLNIATSILWFNPFIWLYKKKLQENLEFLADKHTVNQYNKKEYQYLLLKTGIAKYPFALSNNFYQSLIKKRIIMLQKQKSKKVNQFKYALLLPSLALFLFSFNIKEIITRQNSGNPQEKKPFVNPAHSSNDTAIKSYIESKKLQTTKKNKTTISISQKHTSIKNNYIKEFKDYNLAITSEMSDAELKEITKKFSARNKIKFKIKSIKRNHKNQIMQIELWAKTKSNKETQFNYNSSNAIPTIFLLYNKDEDKVTFEKVKITQMIDYESNGSIKHQEKTYYYNAKNGKITFYNRFGEEVDVKLAEILQKNIQQYLVKEGDSFYSIAKTYQITVEELKKLNSGISFLVKGIYLRVK